MDPFPQYQPPAELNGLHDFLFRLSEDLNDDSAPSTSYQNSYRTSQQSPDFDFGKTSYPGNIPVDSMPYSTAPVPGNLRHSSYAAPQPPPQSLIPTSLIDSIHDSKHRRSQSSTLRSSIDPTGGMQSQPNSQQSYNYDNRPSNQSGNDASYQPAPSVNDGIYYSPVDYNVRTIVTQMKAADSAGEGEKPTIGGLATVLPDAKKTDAPEATPLIAANPVITSPGSVPATTLDQRIATLSIAVPLGTIMADGVGMSKRDPIRAQHARLVKHMLERVAQKLAGNGREVGSKI